MDSETAMGKDLGSAKDVVVTILGTGDYARALAKRLTQAGKSVVCGSRYPLKRNLAKRDPELSDRNINVTSIEKALEASSIVFLALHAEHTQQILREQKDLITDKILVDVTNPTSLGKSRPSHAESLQSTFPQCAVVKAFNTISAYAMESDLDMGDKTVYIASDHPEAATEVSSLARGMGFEAVEYGGLANAKMLEEMQSGLFGDWGVALLIAFPVFIAWLAFATIRYHKERGFSYEEWPLHTLNKIVALTSITLLSLCYLPGCLASIVQLVRGTKHRAFPVWLDRWLKARKQLGLLALWLGGVHCIMSVAHNNSAYFKVFYKSNSFTIPANSTGQIKIALDTKMNWIGEVTFSSGVFTLATMVLLGVASLPSVGGRLNWCQWLFVQSVLGHVCLAIAIAHNILQGIPYTWGEPLKKNLKGVSTISLILPVAALGLRVLLCLPCFYIPLYKIRKGWECCRNNGKESKMENGYSNNRGFSATEVSHF